MKTRTPPFSHARIPKTADMPVTTATVAACFAPKDICKSCRVKPVIFQAKKRQDTLAKHSTEKGRTKSPTRQRSVSPVSWQIAP